MFWCFLYNTKRLSLPRPGQRVSPDTILLQRLHSGSADRGVLGGCLATALCALCSPGPPSCEAQSLPIRREVSCHGSHRRTERLTFWTKRWVLCSDRAFWSFLLIKERCWETFRSWCWSFWAVLLVCVQCQDKYLNPGLCWIIWKAWSPWGPVKRLVLTAGRLLLLCACVELAPSIRGLGSSLYWENQNAKSNFRSVVFKKEVHSD